MLVSCLPLADQHESPAPGAGVGLESARSER